MDRITAIRQSMTAFACGVAACVPFIGLVPAICAVVISERVIRQYHDWNPASEYLKSSRLLALLGLVITLLIGFAILFANASCDGDADPGWQGDLFVVSQK